MLAGLSMFHHVVLYRLKQGVTLERVRAAREALAALVETLPGVEHLSVVQNVAADNGGYTLALLSLFESRRAYEIFNRHPERLRVWQELLDPVVEHNIVVEGETP